MARTEGLQTYIAQSDYAIGESRASQTSAFDKWKVGVGEADSSGRQLVGSTGQEIQLSGPLVADLDGDGALAQGGSLSGVLERHHLAGQVVVVEEVGVDIVIIESGWRDGQRTSETRKHDVNVLVVLLSDRHSLVQIVGAVGVAERSSELNRLGTRKLIRAHVLVVARSKSLNGVSVGADGGHHGGGQSSVLLPCNVSVLCVGDEIFGLGRVCELLLQGFHGFVAVGVGIVHLLCVIIASEIGLTEVVELFGRAFSRLDLARSGKHGGILYCGDREIDDGG